ncbi:MAG TPA: DNA-directed RNA polymerase subunit omega [candidate division Zixibacteria bacterium]|mgnify:CR=1 FL=1|nr:DNA-directed RNA polymerase subunit omega [candidate division Zixibacteria bacterium]MDD4917074.1 DNA-directed RNA polymerase subunit omega [candidate division Zixibacteria bacterium]MDM7972944.1 DNA-directed RNA polymerase subunit omega [candidate division Zixibacteria bacterium]HOD65300.1 DNA-directed RNA polymerase subunit omega [candidate division Zixibacteria bacterium]HOZ07868.1 DNA-directed RNA polymerase subunit omega [candidate division Zixibacteria bacterium]
MKKVPIEQIEKTGLNRYEAVIVASKYARKLNTKRLTLLEQMEDNPEIDIDSRKITMVALNDLIEGKVKFERPR